MAIYRDTEGLRDDERDTLVVERLKGIETARALLFQRPACARRHRR